MTRSRKELGRQGEEWAARYLERRGYRILDRNVYSRFGEIDIVAETGDPDAPVTVFVEVKTRSSASYGYPEEAVDARKKDHLFACASLYIQQHPDRGNHWRVDVIAVESDLDQEQPRLQHFKDIIS